MKFVLSALLSFIINSVIAQNTFEPIDRKVVEATVSDSTSANFYPKLLSRFNQFDTTLSGNDYRLLYYGFAFQNDYNGYFDHKKKEVIKLLNEKKFIEAAFESSVTKPS